MTVRSKLLLETPRFQIARLTHHDIHGNEHSREVVRHPGAVTIIPLLAKEMVCLIRNYRVAVDQTLIELPAGTRDPHEDPRETALRELAEETGYRAGSIEQVHSFYMSPGILDERMDVFVARDLQPGKPLLDSGEQIETLVVPWDRAIQMVREGAIQDAKTIAALLLYHFQRSRVES